MQLSTTLGKTELVVHRYSGVEAVSTPFEFRVGMLSENGAIDLQSLLRTRAHIALSVADGSNRYISGLWRQIKQVGIGQNKLAMYEGVLVPSLWFLSLASDCRIFQNMTAPDIVSKVFEAAGLTAFKLSLMKTYPPREYCVQYRESNLNFVSRLLEEEGIFYFFEHTSDEHTLILADDPGTISECQGQATAFFSLHSEAWAQEVETLEPQVSVHTGKITLSDYDFEKPKYSLLVNVGKKDEVYDYPGKYTDTSDGDRISSIRLDEKEAGRSTVSGTGRCRAFLPGYKFKLSGHFRRDADMEYALVAVQHNAVDSSYFGSDQSSTPFEYSNSFDAIPATTTFRPARRAQKPVIQGVQTALVVGKSGEEIWVYQYGRVKVQFPWDRVGQKDENSSCWVRVSQIWAGKGWGWVSLPRIGQEVVVDFLEGDPDRPIITGRVYNADQTTPYTLPENQTQSGIRTRSSKGGGTANYNEIVFEDKMGSEKLSVHAEKDMDTSVEHDDSQLVENDRTITVKGTHTETITKDTSIEITQGDYSMTIDSGNESRTLKQGNQSIKLNLGNISIKCDLGSISMEAMQSITLKVGENSIKIDQMGIEVSGIMIKVSGEATTQVSGEAMLMLKGGITMIN
ncbi:MAG: type secretion protein ImpA [Bryobacterales bacterium]|nr:type secretion protein ImpA [Bryobacterales bacterium]